MKKILISIVASAMLFSSASFASIVVVRSSLTSSSAIKFSEITAHLVNKNGQDIQTLQLNNMGGVKAFTVPGNTSYGVYFSYKFSGAGDSGSASLGCMHDAPFINLPIWGYISEYHTSHTFDLETVNNDSQNTLCNISPDN